MQKNIEYIVGIYDSTGAQRRIIRKLIQLKSAERLFSKILDQNTVYFERRTVNRGDKHKDIKFYLYLLKEREMGEEQIPIRDDIGRLVKERFKNDKYVILKKLPFKIEEKFIVFGQKGRQSFKDIIKKFMVNSKKLKYVYYFLNKVVIEDYDQFTIIITKNKKDARLLHDKILEFFKTNRLKHGVFMNELDKKNRKRIYSEILKKTGWKLPRLYRSSTRPNR